VTDLLNLDSFSDMNIFNVRELNGSDATPLVLPLYSNEGKGITIHDSDLFFAGFINDELVGSVRFCVEHATPMLRTMRVAKRIKMNIRVHFSA